MSIERYKRQLDSHDDLDEIIMYMQGLKSEDYELSTWLEGKMKDMDTCRDLIRQYGARHKVTSMLQSMLHVSKSTAERIYQDTLYVYNTTQRTNRDFWIDHAMGMIMETRNKALIKQDMKTVAACDSNMVKLISLMSDSKDADIYKRLTIPRVVVSFNPDQTGVELPENWEKKVQEMIKAAKDPNRNVSAFDETEFSDGDDGAE